MDNWKIVGTALAAVIVLLTGAYYFGGVMPSNNTSSNLSYVELPEGFNIEVYTEKDFGGSSVSYPGPNPGPRFMAVKNDTLFVTIPNEGRVVAMPDKNNDGDPDEYVTVVDGLNRPHGIELHNNQLYIANTGSVVRFNMDGLEADRDSKEVLVDDIPEGGMHWTRTLQIHNESMFISTGSNCNVCEGERTWRTKIRQCSLDGSNCTTYASGLRNAVGFI